MEKIIGKKILFYDTVISTMDLAKKLIGNVDDIGTLTKKIEKLEERINKLERT